MENNYKRTVAGSVGAGIASVFNASGRQYYILEHKTETQFHHAGESQKIIIDQIELGRAASCQVRFDEGQDTVSRRHAAIVKEGNGWKIINLSQTNATFVNGQAIQGEWNLSSGDEIRLSSKGPVMGFIVPQGGQSLVKSIGLTERMNLFRKQALRPYKTAITIISIVFVIVIAALVVWKIQGDKQYQKLINDKQEQIENVRKEIEAKDSEINTIKMNLDNVSNKSDAEVKAIRLKLEKDEEEKNSLIKQSEALMKSLDSLKSINSKKEAPAEVKDAGEEQPAAAPAKSKAAAPAEATKNNEPSIEDLINATRKENPTINKN